jgi:hypothetical protein
MKQKFSTGDIVIHEKYSSLLEVTHGSSDKCMVTYDFANTEYEVEVDDLILVCRVENRRDI